MPNIIYILKNLFFGVIFCIMKKRDFISSNFKYTSNRLFDLNSNTKYAIVVNKARKCKKSKFLKCDPAVSSRGALKFITQETSWMRYFIKWFAAKISRLYTVEFFSFGVLKSKPTNQEAFQIYKRTSKPP